MQVSTPNVGGWIAATNVGLAASFVSGRYCIHLLFDCTRLTCDLTPIAQQPRRVHVGIFSMAAPFGFSISDFIAVINVAIAVTKALSDGKGAVKSYSLLHNRLRSLFELMSSVHTRVAAAAAEGHRRMPPKALAAICYHIDCCSILMTDFLVRTVVCHVSHFVLNRVLSEERHGPEASFA